MPTYGYKCNKCNHTFEILQKITDDPITECEQCGGELKKLLYPVGIVFKGSGFHINDYRKSDSGGGNGNGSTQTKTETETKTETTTPKETTPAVSETK